VKLDSNKMKNIRRETFKFIERIVYRPDHPAKFPSLVNNLNFKVDLIQTNFKVLTLK